MTASAGYIGCLKRKNKWTESLALGSQQFAKNHLDPAGLSANSQRVKAVDDGYVVNVPNLAYSIDL